MSSSFHESFDRHDLPLPPDRSTGLVFAAISLIIAYLFRSNTVVLIAALAAGSVLAAVSLTVPHVLRPLNVMWMQFALLLSRIINPIVMLVLFAIIIIPAGLIMQTRRDPLRRRRSGSETSYWIMREPDGRSSMGNQF